MITIKTKMNFYINNQILQFNKIYNKYIYKSPLLNTNDKDFIKRNIIKYLEVSDNLEIKINGIIYTKNDLIVNNTKNNDFENYYLITKTYTLNTKNTKNNIIIGTFENNDKKEEILYIMYKDTKFYESLAVPINHIIDNIYIGNLSGAIDDQLLDDYEIKNIVQVFDGFEPMFPNKYNYLIISIDDNGDIQLKKYFDEFINFVKNIPKNNNIFIHCQHGSSRSGTFVLLYLMHFHNMNYDDALSFAKQKRYGICPNDGFKSQLISYISNIS